MIMKIQTYSNLASQSHSCQTSFFRSRYRYLWRWVLRVFNDGKRLGLEKERVGFRRLEDFESVDA